MPQQRDPIVYEVEDILRDEPWNMLITPKASQSSHPPGVSQDVMYIDNVSVMDDESSGVICDLGFMVGGHITWTRTFVMTTATYWYRNHTHWTLTSDYQIVARFRITANNGGGAVGDTVHMHVNGFYLEPYSSP